MSNVSDSVLNESPGISAPSVRRSREPLRVLGTSVTQIDPIMRAAEEDLDLSFDFITLDGTEAQRRGALSPDSFDVYDQWFHDIDLIWPTASIQPININRINRWDQINDLPKKGRLMPGMTRATGGDPSQRLFVQLDNSLGNLQSERISMVPTVHNADGFAVVGTEAASIDSWGALLEPEWAGRVVLQSDAAIGSLDMLLALRARNELDFQDPGNLTLEEIDDLIELLKAYKLAGHFRCIWADEEQAVRAMRQGKPAIGSLWWSGVIKLRALGASVTMVTPKEGYRGWFGGLALSARLDDWSKDAAYDYINWWLDGKPGAIMARAGAYMSNPESVKRWLSEEEWAFWYEGKPATVPIKNPSGQTIYETGSVREGGSYKERMAHVAVWDTVMEEHNYLVRRWENVLSN
ncbi:MAG: extracellular solute-binding protein [Stappiaceae bacterium]